MCDEHSLDDMVDYLNRKAELSRRSFGALALGAGLSITLPRVANAVAVTESNVEIKTPDGVCDAYFVHPTSGASAAVLIWPDAGGLREAFKQMGKRLAESGYTVLVPNPFYRTRRADAPAAAPNASGVQDEAARTAMMATMRSLNPTTHVTDAKAFVAWLDAQPATDKKKKMGTTGYCMGGPIVFRTAATFPDRIGGAATFHGGGLVADNTDSPHLLIPKMKAQYLIAIAANDDERQPDAKDVLRKSFAEAKLPAEIEVYKDTKHGWCPPDGAVYDAAQAEKAWSRMTELFKKALV
ncbi:MAG: dienelactone hydrolase family protein [Steroidobacteraceae bacterium]